MKYIIHIILFWILSFSFGITATVTIDLKSGYNLVNLEEASLDTIVDSIGLNNLISIQGTSQGSAYKKQYIDDNKAFLNTFLKAEKAMGYWVNIQTDTSMVLEKALYSGTQTISLVSGWNLFAPLDDITIEDVVTQLGTNNLQVIQGAKQNSAYKKQYIDDNKAFLNTLTTLEKGQGYWINLTTSTDISFVFELEQIALDNADNEVIISTVIDNQTYIIKLYASNTPTSPTSQSTLPSYGTLLGETVVMYVNETYGLDTQFQAKYYDENGNLLGMSEIVDITDGYIHFDDLKAIDTTPTTPQQRPFITTWKTDNEGYTNDNEIKIGTNPNYTYNYNIDWGDGNIDEGVTGDKVHTYTTVGTYTVKISGEFPSFYMYGTDRDNQKLLTVEQWGDIEWKSMSNTFNKCSNFIMPATDSPNLSNVTNMTSMFFGASNFNQPIEHWDVSNVTRMILTFYEASSFNQSLNNWDVSNVTNMANMFGAFTRSLSFNQPLNNWDVSNVTDMRNMFRSAISFNQPLNNWDVSNVSKMGRIFYQAKSFNQPLNNWDISGITDMRDMLKYTNISTQNYDDILNNWSQQSLQNSVTLDLGTIKYTSSASTARQFMIDTYGWTIIDGGMVADVVGVDLTIDMTKNGNKDNTVYAGDTITTVIKYQNIGDTPTTDVIINSYYDYREQMDSASFILLSAPAGVNCFNTSEVDPSSGTQQKLIHCRNTQGITANSELFEIKYTMRVKSDATVGSQSYHDASISCPEYESNRNNNVSSGTLTIGATQRPFITTWKTDNAGYTNNNQIKIGTNSAYTYNYNIDWGDGNVDKGVTGDKIHTYDDVGTYTVEITGVFPSFYMYGSDKDPKKLLTVEQWGDIAWKSMYYTFYNCSNLTIPAIDAPNLSNVTDMSYMFYGATSFNQSVNHWDVSSITSMRGLFKDATIFNKALDTWDTSMVEDMRYMFYDATSFNQALDMWNTTKVDNMKQMFKRASNFNKPINSWITSNVTDMREMFYKAFSFNSPLNNWNISNVTRLSYMFREASSFNQPLNSWNISKITSLSHMFSYATSFNQSLENWDISTITDMNYMLSQTNISTTNYDNILKSWATQSLQLNVSFGVGDTQYTSNASSARQSLIDNYGWVITDGGITGVITPQAPTAYAGSNENVTKGDTLTLSGSGSTGSIVSYQWKKGSTIVSNSSSFSQTFNTVGTYTYTLTVTNDEGLSHSHSINITVNEATSTNHAPVADAGSPKSMTVGESITITGSGMDSDGDSLTYQWTKNGVFLSSSRTFTYTPTSIGTHTLTLIVRDSKGKSSMGNDMIVTVNQGKTDKFE